jgi:hypothetical protein
MAAPSKAGRGNHIRAAGEANQCSSWSTRSDTGERDAHPEAATMGHPSRRDDTEEELLEYHQLLRHQVPRILAQAALGILVNIGATTSMVPLGVQSPRAIPVRKVRRPYGNRGMLQRHIPIPSAKGDRTYRHKRT